MQNASASPLDPRLAIRACPLGRGVFARGQIRPAEPILRLTGPAITREQVRAKGNLSFNVLQIGPQEYLDLEEPGVCLNHRCDPNAGIVDDTVLIALREIAPGEEITYDYSTTMSEKFETMHCLCGAPNCRQIIGDFHDLPPTLKDRYLAARLVQGFIVREHRDKRQRTRHGRPALTPVAAPDKKIAKFFLGQPAPQLDRECA